MNTMFSHDTGQRDATFSYIPITQMAHPQKSANAPTNRMGATYLQPNVSVQTSQVGDRPTPIAPAAPVQSVTPPTIDKTTMVAPGEEVTPAKASRMAAAFQWPVYPPSLLDRLKPYGLYA